MKIPQELEDKELLDNPPTELRANYHPTCDLAWFICRNEEDLVLGQKWVSDYEGVPEKWVRLKLYTNTRRRHND